MKQFYFFPAFFLVLLTSLGAWGADSYEFCIRVNAAGSFIGNLSNPGHAFITYAPINGGRRDRPTAVGFTFLREENQQASDKWSGVVENAEIALSGAYEGKLHNGTYSANPDPSSSETKRCKIISEEKMKAYLRYERDWAHKFQNWSAYFDSEDEVVKNCIDFATGAWREVSGEEIPKHTFPAQMAEELRRLDEGDQGEQETEYGGYGDYSQGQTAGAQ